MGETAGTMTATHPEAPVLRIRSISKSFPGVNALTDMTIDLRHAEVHAVCGENGAGKSTLMKIITGIYKPDRGSMELNGEILEVKNPNEAYARGIAIIFQETSLFPDLTVLENIFMGHELRRPLLGAAKLFSILDYPAMRTKAKEIFDRLGMAVDLDVRVADLGVATKQMVEIAKALSFDSRILILDEPTASLTNKEVDTLFETIRNLKSHGVSMLYISHRLDEVFQIADRVTVIRDGAHIHTEEVAKVTKDQLVSWMVGRTLTNLYPKETCEIGEVVFEARGITQAGVLKGIDLQLRRGEILGLSGLAGAGRTELAMALCGLTRLDAGRILIDGKPVHFTSYRQAMDHGIVYISEDRAEVRAGRPHDDLREHYPPAPGPDLRRDGDRGHRRGTPHQRHLHGEAGDQGPERGLRRQQPLRRQPAEGVRGKGAGHDPPDPHPGRADTRRRRRGEERDPPHHQQPREGRQVDHHDFQRPARDHRDERPRARHEDGLQDGRAFPR